MFRWIAWKKEKQYINGYDNSVKFKQIFYVDFLKKKKKTFFSQQVMTQRKTNNFFVINYSAIEQSLKKNYIYIMLLSIDISFMILTV